jgi:hypothetical protein
VALGVYAIVMVLVARVVSRLERVSATSRSHETNARRLFEISQLLIDKPVPELAHTIVDAVRDSFGFAGAALLLSVDGRLEVAATGR